MITLILHLYDNTDNPKRSQQNATEPIYLDRNEHVIELFCGEGMQSIKWLTLAAAGRLKHLRKNTMTGRVRFREAYLGIDSQFLMPSSIDTKRRDAKDDTNLLPLKNPYAKIKDVFEDQDHIWINFDERGGTVTKWKTTAYHLDKELVIPKPQSPKKEESVLDEVISCMSKDWWKKTQLKSWKKRNDRHGKDRNRVMRVGETPEIDMHETSLEEENSIHERIEYPNRNVYKLPDPVTRALGRDFHNYCS